MEYCSLCIKRRQNKLPIFIAAQAAAVKICPHSIPEGNPLRDWVIATAAPGVTGEDTFEGEPAAFEEAILLDCFDAVVGTSGYIATALPDKGRQRHLIDPNQEDQEFGGQLGDAFHDWRATYFLINSLTALWVFSSTSS